MTEPSAHPAGTDLTANQRTVFDTLAAAKWPLTAYQVIDRVKATGLSAPPTVYRALNRLIGLGMVHRIESLSAYVACAHDHGPGDIAAFAICRKCGSATEISDCALPGWLIENASKNGFAMDGAVLELQGVCARCR